jgi:hypothetical protein
MMVLLDPLPIHFDLIPGDFHFPHEVVVAFKSSTMMAIWKEILGTRQLREWRGTNERS